MTTLLENKPNVIDSINRRTVSDKNCYNYHRRYVRLPVSYPVQCAVMPDMNVNPTRFNRLRWLETESYNFSSGGIMVSVPEEVKAGSYLLLNVEADQYNFPKLVVGQVRYCHQADKFNYMVGLKFIVREKKENHFPQLTIQRLPKGCFELTDYKRDMLNDKLQNNYNELMEIPMSANNSSTITGDTELSFKAPFEVATYQNRSCVRLEVNKKISIKCLKDSSGQITFEDNTPYIEASILNMSPQGMLIECKQQFNQKDIIISSVNVVGVDDNKYIIGRVKRIEQLMDNYLVGVEFPTKDELGEYLSAEEMDLLDDSACDLKSQIENTLGEYLIRC